VFCESILLVKTAVRHRQQAAITLYPRRRSEVEMDQMSITRAQMSAVVGDQLLARPTIGLAFCKILISCSAGISLICLTSFFNFISFQRRTNSVSTAKSSRKLHAWNSENMVEALAAVKSGDMSERKVAVHFDVPRSSLQDRLKNTSDIGDVKPRLG